MRLIVCLWGIGLAASVPAFAGISESQPSHSLGSSGGFNYRAVSATLDSTDIDLFAICNQSAAVVGGGVDVNGPAKGSRITYGFPGDSYLDADSKPSDHWRGAAQEVGPVASRRITTYAVCRKAGEAGIAYKSKQEADVPDGATVALKVRCPAGTSVASGGSDVYRGTIPTSEPYDGGDADAKRDDGWRIRARNEEGSPYTVTAYAVCLPHSIHLRYVKRSAKTPANAAKTLSATCRKGAAVVGGGQEIKGSTATRFVHSSKPVDTRSDANHTPDDRWRVTAVNLGGSAAKTTVHAICAT